MSFHKKISYNKTIPEDRWSASAKTVVKNTVAGADEMDGTCTGEHGIDVGKKHDLAQKAGLDMVIIMASCWSSKGIG